MNTYIHNMSYTSLMHSALSVTTQRLCSERTCNHSNQSDRFLGWAPDGRIVVVVVVVIAAAAAAANVVVCSCARVGVYNTARVRTQSLLALACVRHIVDVVVGAAAMKRNNQPSPHTRTATNNIVPSRSHHRRAGSYVACAAFYMPEQVTHMLAHMVYIHMHIYIV